AGTAGRGAAPWPALAPAAAPATEITITVDGKELGTLQREITAAYLNNYSSIVLTGKSLPKITRIVRDMLHDFVAVEITEQTGTRLVAKDLLNLEEIAVDKTIRRMDMMLRSLYDDAIAGTASAENALLRDKDINRLFFLLYRLLKRSVDDHAMAKRLGLSGTQLLSTWAMIHHLESIADIAARLPDMLDALKKPAREDANAAIVSIREYYLSTMKSYYATDRDLADKVAAQRAGLVETHTAIIKKFPDLATAEFTMQFAAMASLVADIARVVIDENAVSGTSPASQ
ncbi:MAG: hypothetical protein AABY13_00705, partial [Nanoarchaeota archaeon]